jgi:asparagine synthase (glutamine-hydrolysing)
MCGIAGIYNAKGENPETLMRISNVLKHRGPDDEGFCIWDNNELTAYKGNDTPESIPLKHITESAYSPKLAFIHRRLSILDVSVKGHQPMTDDKKNIVLTYNGEIYNYLSLREELKNLGYQFSSNTDTEVLLNAYKAWGTDCVKKLSGMWAFCIFDTTKNILFLSKDRFGIKPLYYFQKNDFLIFASEIKALLAHPLTNASLSEKQIISYVSFGTYQQPYQNLFKEIKDLPPAHNMLFDLNTQKISIQPYYQLQKTTLQSINYTSTFDELFTNTITSHLQSDVEVGTCLSGGLDSSAIVYNIAQRGMPLKTFTAAYKDPKIDESNYAKLVTDAFKNITPYYTYPSAEGIVNDLDKLVYYQDLPVGSMSIYAHWEVMKLVRQQNVKVVINGQGSDEVLGGYYNFAGIYLVELIKKWAIVRFLKEKHALKKHFSSNINNAFFRAAYYYLPEFLQAFLRKKERLSFAFVNKDALEAFPVKIPQRGGKSFLEHTELSLKFNIYELLRYEDRNSMAFSIESRVPFLDHKLLEFLYSLPIEMKLQNGWTKFIIRDYLNGKLDDKVVWRIDKMGFLTPQQAWKKTLDKKLIEDIESSNIPSLLNKSFILDLCKKDFGNNAHLSEFWRLYSLIKWYNVYNLSV